ncbi:hypothetical protein PAHAL_7G200000 [Panicum hallii]|jgi:hypothetical protein|uniref:RING-type domain-containing protein n=1 Tax=Panicum hallii TaxID=206008 RepID=A0A2T8ICW5_9POAL|nr:E3 ubiquitin-protein ligase RNF149-like [Panicum hallii]PVH35498.1 hypothetical protein PAHAL_7G200000 [Panicum hallii]
MADDDDVNLGQAVAVVAVGSVSMLVVVGVSFWAMEAYVSGRLARGWRWLRVRALGGVTTLRRELSYNCAMCQYSLAAHEEVRTLSCNHVFHCRESDKCRNVIDRWLVQESMICPICRRIPLPVLPWKARPPLSPAPSGSAEPPMPVSSSGLEENPPPISSPGSEEPSPGLEDPLLQSSQ